MLHTSILIKLSSHYQDQIIFTQFCRDYVMKNFKTSTRNRWTSGRKKSEQERKGYYAGGSVGSD